MRQSAKIVSIISLLVPVGLLGLALMELFFWVGPLGTWQGVLDTGGSKFRIALVLQRDPDGTTLALFNNIDDGIYGEPFKVFLIQGNHFRGELSSGEKLDLSLNWFGLGGELSGSYTQAQGSFQRPGEVSRLVLRQGEEYLNPRLGAGGVPVREEHYHIPEKNDDGWEVGGMSGDPLARDKLLSGIGRILKGEIPHIHGLLVVKKGKLVVDEYFYGYGPQEIHPIQSVTKSVFSLLFGVARDQGLVGEGQKLYSFFPEYRSARGWNEKKSRITLGMLLTMRSGFDCDDWKDSKACSWEMVNSPDWVRFALTLPLGGEPGGHFAYCGACLTPLPAILVSKSGLALPVFAEKYLFGPLGIKDFEWMKGPGETTPASFGLSLRPRDLAKLGQLILNKGKWGGEQVVSEDWINQSTSVQVRRNGKDQADYGFLWWIRTFSVGGKNIQVIDGWGVGGNHLFIVPELDLVCVITAGNYKDGALGTKSIEFFKDYVLGL